MKKYIILLGMALLSALSAGAQSKSFRTFYDKYNGQEGYTVIEMSGSMFKVINELGETTDKELANALDKVKKLVIIVGGKADSVFGDDVFQITENYDMLSSINDGGDIIKFYTEKSRKEFLMVIKDEDEIMVLSIVGDKLDPKQIAQYTKIRSKE